MEALYLLVPLSVFIVVLAVWVFFGAADSGQFDDLDGPGMRILLDDEDPAEKAPRNDLA
ncbi:cbb3-type cytochrome oxidase assembly protein CcoS [Massilia sp. CCM 8695]|uniref:Cbb3-type cytochrome oxidase assembly protein CcoS n=1 Tax=Massilia frigida TaxID=2609281 RepID=A0ABX0NC92_9BURK|nr:cbb3-type cytochrome oxidase assembly protein CcoS [Massilia frigida]NHZ80876.1 cbb3-type cytochrome oxidase assembly protein CcoS [Massilia frigida]